MKSKYLRNSSPTSCEKLFLQRKCTATNQQYKLSLKNNDSFVTIAEKNLTVKPAILVRIRKKTVNITVVIYEKSVLKASS